MSFHSPHLEDKTLLSASSPYRWAQNIPSMRSLLPQTPISSVSQGGSALCCTRALTPDLILPLFSLKPFPPLSITISLCKKFSSCCLSAPFRHRKAAVRSPWRLSSPGCTPPALSLSPLQWCSTLWASPCLPLHPLHILVLGAPQWLCGHPTTPILRAHQHSSCGNFRPWQTGAIAAQGPVISLYLYGISGELK